MDSEEISQEVISNIIDISKTDVLPKDHVNKLYELRELYNFNPEVIYDIGSCVLHWTRHAEEVWKESKIYLFEAFSPCEFLYKEKKYEYHMGIVTDLDNKVVKFYQNELSLGGNSCYKEKDDKVYPEDKFVQKIGMSLDTIVKNKSFRYPDLIKMDVQGSEYDILKGAKMCLEHTKFLILELQSVEYNQGAPFDDYVIYYLDTIGFDCLGMFSNNGPDGDYLFRNREFDL